MWWTTWCLSIASLAARCMSPFRWILRLNVGSIVGLQSGSIHAGGINLREALSGLQDAPLRGPYRAAEREVDGYTTILVQHFFRAFEGEFGSANALSCSSEFQRQNIGRHPATVGVQSVHHGLLTHGGAVRSLFTLVLRRLAACSQAGAGALASCLASLCSNQSSGAGIGFSFKCWIKMIVLASMMRPSEMPASASSSDISRTSMSSPSSAAPPPAEMRSAGV